MASNRRNPLRFKRLSCLGAFVLLLAIWSVSAIAQDRSLPALNVKPRLPRYDPGQPVLKKVLKNGVTLLVQEQRTSERVAGSLALRMGTLYESDDQAGYSRLLMTTLTAGTKAHAPQDLALALKAAEAEVSTDVAAEQGRLSIVSNREHVDRMVDLLAEIALQPSFPDSSFDGAKMRSLVLASQETESPIKATYTMFLDAMYRGSPLHRPVVGTVRAISECRRSDVVELHQRFFVGGNMVVALVGNFQGASVMERLARLFGAAPAGGPPKPEPGDPVPLAADTTVSIERNYLAQSLVYGFPAPGYEDADHAAFRVIESYLALPDRSPLAYWLPQRELAFGVGVVYSPFAKHSSIAVYLGATTPNWKAARDSVESVMRRLTTEPLDETDWFTNVDRVLDEFLVGLDDPANRARSMSQYELMGAGHDYLQRFELKVIGLTPEDVRAAAARWFTHSCEATIAPVKSESKL